MKNLLFVAFVLAVFGLQAQTTIKKSSISTSGGTMTSGNREVIFTVGETNVQETDTGNVHLSEGFIGPDIAEALDIADYGILSGVSIYPNPVTEIFSVRLTQRSHYEFYIFDLQGKRILSRQSQDANQTFDIGFLTAGSYLLIVIDRDSKRKKVFKIIKK